MDPKANPYTALPAVRTDSKAVKVVRDGQLLILADGKYYNLLGTPVQ